MANLNTSTEIRDEGMWLRDAWSSRITTEPNFNTFVDGIATRANVLLQLRVNTAWYAANVAVAPWATVLKAAEMHLTQAFLLEAAAQIAENGSDLNPAPFLGDAEQLLSVAKVRYGHYEEMVDLTRTTARRGQKVPYAKGMVTTSPEVERFDEATGTDSDPFDETYDDGAPA